MALCTDSANKKRTKRILFEKNALIFDKPHLKISVFIVDKDVLDKETSKICYIFLDP